jgi:hypothetical protein
MTNLADLSDLRMWVAWQLEPDRRKVPYYINGRLIPASSTNAATWGTRFQADRWHEALPKPRPGMHGVGLVLAPVGGDLHVCGVDLDTCVEGGTIADWAHEVVKRFDSYTELSPSETGTKIFFTMRTADRNVVLAEIRQTGDPEREGAKWARGADKDHPPGIELYLGKRYFAVTGRRVEGTPVEIRCVGAEDVLWLVREAGPAFLRGWAGAGGARDNSRSGRAFRRALEFARGGAGDYEEVREGLLAALREDPEVASWVSEKGLAHGERELKRIWEKATKRTAWDYRYAVVGGALCYRRQEKGGWINDIELANFAARIAEEQVVDDGATRTRRYRVAGTLVDGTRLPDAAVDAALRFSGTSWVNEHWGARAIVYPGAGTQMLEAAIKTVSGRVPSRQIFAHLGWRRVDGAWLYLHGDGAIGQGGPVGGIDVEIRGTLAHCLLPPVEDLGAAVGASLGMLDLGSIGAAVAAATYRAPLGEIAPIPLSVHLAGMTGTFKSAIEGVAQSHWGSHWNGVRFPANWADTANDIELKSFLAKDTLFGVDEFLPRGRGRHQTDELYAKAERLFRGQANQSGRGRLDATIRERPVHWPRGFTISSGEDIPSGHSLLARVVVVQVKKGDIPPEKLTTLQAAGAGGLLAQAMAGYVQWLAGRIDRLGPWFTQRREELRREAIGAHRRTPQNYAELVIGCEAFLAFAFEAGAIAEGRRGQLLEDAKEHLKRLMECQDEGQQAEDVAEVFLTALGAALAGGRVYAEDWGSRQAPIGFEEACGWRGMTHFDEQGNETVVWRAQGDRIGWLKYGTELYLIGDAAYGCVERLLNRPIGVSKRTLFERLGEAGAIADHDPGKNSKLVSAGGEKLRVLALRASRVLIDTPDRAPSNNPR